MNCKLTGNSRIVSSIHICSKYYVTLLIICCFGLFKGYSQEAHFEWARVIETPKDAYLFLGSMAMDMDVDKEGNMYVTGTFPDTVDFDPGSGTFLLGGPSMFFNAFVAKYSAAGNFVWAKTFSGSSAAEMGMPTGLTVDDSGYVYVSGGFFGTVDFNPGSGTSTHTTTAGAAFVVKLDEDGEYIWSHSIEKVATQNNVAVDKWGNVFVGGWTENLIAGDVIMLGNISIVNTNNHGEEVFVAKLNASGIPQWGKFYGGPDHEGFNSIDVDDEGSIYFTGIIGTSDTSYFEGILVTGEYYIVKADSSGKILWAKSIKEDTNAAYGSCFVYDLKVDNFGGVYTTGVYSGGVDFGMGGSPFVFEVVSTSNPNAFVLKMDTAGNFAWAKAFRNPIQKTTYGNPSTAHGNAIDIDRAGNVYALGDFTDSIDFDPGSGSFFLVAPPDRVNSVYITKLDSSGNFTWAKELRASSSVLAAGYSIDVSSSGNIYSIGLMSGTTVDFDPGPDTALLSSLSPVSTFYLHKLGCSPDSVELVVTSDCNGYTIGDEVYSQSGTYNIVLTNRHGCDSLIMLDLTIRIPEVDITIDVDILSTLLPYTTYQWYKDGDMIPGATQREYKVIENGKYHVDVSDSNGCSGTSEPYRVNNLSINDVYSLSQVSIHPNPSKDIVYINSPIQVNVTLTNLEGKVLLQQENVQSVSTAHLANGIYFLNISDKEGKRIKVEKLVIQN
jgi:hypothetical protein